jgi:transposase-like protein
MQAQDGPNEHAESTVGQAASEVLPAPNTHNWTRDRKAQVVAALLRGDVTFPDACKRYGLSPEELASWEQSYRWGGKHGLTLAGLKERRMAVCWPVQD